MKTSDIIKYVFMIILILFVVYFYINLIIFIIHTNKKIVIFNPDSVPYKTGSMIGTAPLKSNNSYTIGIGIKCLENASIKQPIFIGSKEIPTQRIGWKKGKLNINNTTYNVMGKCNIIIGEGAGKQLTYESFCVIVGHDSIAINAKGKNMMWIVDWNEPYLLKHPEIKILLKEYVKNIRMKNMDNLENRIELILNIIEVTKRRYDEPT